MDPERADALIGEIGQKILGDPSLVDNPWDSTVFVAVLSPRPTSIYGFRYIDGVAHPTTPTSLELNLLLDELRQATTAPDGSVWNALAIWIDGTTMEFDMEFEQDNPERFRLTPENYQTMSEELRP